jgi:hypothetical protein
VEVEIFHIAFSFGSVLNYCCPNVFHDPFSWLTGVTIVRCTVLFPDNKLIIFSGNFQVIYQAYLL